MLRLPLLAAILLSATVCTATSVRSSDDVDESSQTLRHISSWDNFLAKVEDVGNRIDQGLDKIKADVKDAWDRFVAWTGRSVRSPDGQPVDVEKRRILPYYPWKDLYFKRDALGVQQEHDRDRRLFSSWDEFLGHVEDVGNRIDLGFDKIKADVKEAWDKFKAESGRSVRAQEEDSSPEKRIYHPPVEWPWEHAGGWKDIYIKRDPLDATRDNDRNRRLFSSWDEFLGKVENVGNRIDQGIDKIKSDVKEAWDKFVAESGRSVRSDETASPEKRIYPPHDQLDWPYKPWHDIYYKRDQLDVKRDDDDDDRERRLLGTWDDFLDKVENVGNRIDQGIDKIKADVKEAWDKFVAETGKRNVRSPVELENPGSLASPEKRVYHPYDPLNSPPIYYRNLKGDDSDDDKQKRIYPPTDLIDWPYKPWPNDIYFKREQMDEDRARRLLGPFKPIELPYKPWPYDITFKRDQVDEDRARRLFGTWDDFLAKVENVGNRIDQGIDEIKADVKEAWDKFVAETGRREVRSDGEVSSEKRVYPPFNDDPLWPPYKGWNGVYIRDEPELAERETEQETSAEKRIYIDEYNWPHKHVGWKDIYPTLKKRAYNPYDNIIPGDI